MLLYLIALPVRIRSKLGLVHRAHGGRLKVNLVPEKGRLETKRKNVSRSRLQNWDGRCEACRMRAA